MSTELEQLIREQARDDTPFQAPQPFTIHYQTMDSGSVFDTFADLKDPTSKSCGIHGFTYMYYRPNGRIICRECSRLYLENRRRMRGVKPRHVGGRDPVRYREYQRAYDATPERKRRQAIARKKYKQSEEGKAYQVRYNAKRRERYRLKREQELAEAKGQ